MKSKTVTFLLCAFLGFLGVHRFYTQKIVTGVLMLVTGGLLGLWQLVDMVLIASGRFRDTCRKDRERLRRARTSSGSRHGMR